MTANTKIEWADHTFNPWIGCTKVGPGCDNCYAEADFDKRRHVVQWGPNQPRKRTAPSTWAQPLRWNKMAEAEGTRYRVFCASLADVFDNAVPAEWRAELFVLIDQTPNLDWLLLTKRIGNVAKMIEAPGMQKCGLPSNVWLGATVCNQEEANRDIPKLLEVPAEKRFLSIEPMLGPVDLTSEYLTAKLGSYPFNGLPAEHRTKLIDMLDWVIVGGESGPKARPMHPDWVRSLRDQCQEAGVAFLFKQWGEWHTAAVEMSSGKSVFRQFRDFQTWVNKARTWVNGGKCLDRNGREMNSGGDMIAARDEGRFPVTIMHRVGKKAAGRLLDGREWNEVPQTGGSAS